MIRVRRPIDLRGIIQNLRQGHPATRTRQSFLPVIFLEGEKRRLPIRNPRMFLALVTRSPGSSP